MAIGYYYAAQKIYELQVARQDLPEEATPGSIVDVPEKSKIISKREVKPLDMNLLGRAPTDPRRMLLTRLE